MKQLDQAYYHKQNICERIKLRAELADGICFPCNRTVDHIRESDSDINKAVKTDKVRSFIDGDCGAWNKFLTSSDIEAIKNPDFAPGNACIKALYAK